jgi:hypothetical protein
MLDNNSQKYSSKGLGDIVDWQKSERFSLTRFRQMQDKLLKSGFHQSMTICNDACSSCGGKQIDLTFTQGVIELNYEGCLNCWTFVELYPVYENFHADRDALVARLRLLDEKQLLLIGSIVQTIIG